jgi:hypothetical protein
MNAIHELGQLLISEKVYQILLNLESEFSKRFIFKSLSIKNKKLSLSLETSLKQNEADLIMAKKNADLAKVNHEKIHNELVNEKTIIENLKTQVNLMTVLTYFYCSWLHLKNF